MKYYYGNSVKEALSNKPINISSTKVLIQYQEQYTVVIPYYEDNLCKFIVQFDIDNQNLEADFDSMSEAVSYAKSNIDNFPSITKCSQSDTSVELGFGDDYDEDNVTRDDNELAKMLDQLMNS